MAGSIPPDEALERLLAGNRRFVEGIRDYPDQSPDHRRALAGGQHPIAAVLGCADSRVPPEMLFDQGLGDLFTVRVAGNIVDNAALGSLEYAVEHLGVRLVVVLGHSSCGAVQAAVSGGHAAGQIAALVAAIQPAVEQARLRTMETPEHLLAQAVRENVSLVVRQLRAAAPILASPASEGALQILGACYDLSSGEVEVLS